MLKLIIELYRTAVGLMFVAGAVLAIVALIIDAGGMGPMAALIIIGATALATGVSALLLSINDHLAALRNK